MKHFTQLLAIFIATMFFIVACSPSDSSSAISIDTTKTRGVKLPTPDTTQILRITLEKAFTEERLPSSNKLLSNSYKKDSILLCLDFPYAEEFVMPKVGNFKFKLLSKEKLCQLVQNEQIDVSISYLLIHNLKVEAHFASVKIDHACLSPVTKGTGSSACNYFGNCGGGLEFQFIKPDQIWTGNIINHWER